MPSKQTTSATFLSLSQVMNMHENIINIKQ